MGINLQLSKLMVNSDGKFGADGCIAGIQSHDIGINMQAPFNAV
jgi:hypothetical protein